MSNFYPKKLSPRDFWTLLDKWYNPAFFYQDRDGVWHEKFEVGVGLIDKKDVLF